MKDLQVGQRVFTQDHLVGRIVDIVTTRGVSAYLVEVEETSWRYPYTKDELTLVRNEKGN